MSLRQEVSDRSTTQVATLRAKIDDIALSGIAQYSAARPIITRFALFVEKSRDSLWFCVVCRYQRRRGTELSYSAVGDRANEPDADAQFLVQLCRLRASQR